MRILDRYLLKGFLFPFFYCLVLFSVVFTIIDSFNNLDEYIKYGSNLRIILSYYFFLLPALLVQIIPISILVAILYVLGHLNRHNEIIALKASGVSAFRILSPYLFTGILISFSILLINETVVPKTTITSTAIFDGLITKGKKNLGERAIKNVAIYGQNHHMIYARELELVNKTLHDVVILEDSPGNVMRSIARAKKAYYDDDHWVLNDVIQYQMDENGEMVGEPSVLPETTLDIPDKPQDFIREASQVEFMSARQLGEYIEKLNGAGKRLIHRLRVDFYHKVALPFVSCIILLVGAPLAMKTGRGSAVIGIGTSLFVVVLYYGIESICLALGKGGTLPPLLSAWSANIIFLFVGIYLMRKTS